MGDAPTYNYVAVWRWKNKTHVLIIEYESKQLHLQKIFKLTNDFTIWIMVKKRIRRSFNDPFDLMLFMLATYDWF